jgi:hypothetical protein
MMGTCISLRQKTRPSRNYVARRKRCEPHLCLELHNYVALYFHCVCSPGNVGKVVEMFKKMCL